MNITVTADDHLIERARIVARSRHTTLNAAFQQWLIEYTSKAVDVGEYDALMSRLSHVTAGRTFTRDEMNDRSDRPLSSNAQAPGSRQQ
jgi:hypothetical protein